VATIQNVNPAIPVVARPVPPEGARAAPITFTLSPAAPLVSSAFNMSDQAGLMLSQVVTLVAVNNSVYTPILITHGILDESFVLAPGSQAIVPTFSSQGSYPLAAEAVGGTTAETFTFEAILLNYERTPGLYSLPLPVAVTVQNTGENSQVITGTTFHITATSNINLTGNGNWILDSLDFACENVIPTAAGNFICSVSLATGATLIDTLYITGLAAAADVGNLYPGLG